MTYTRNEGISISGGSFTATNAAVGRNAQINQTQSGESETAKEVQRQLDLLLKLLEQHGNQIANKEEVIEAAHSVKEQVAREKPNGLQLKSLLAGIADSVKSVSTIAIAAEGLKAAVMAMLG